MISIAATPLLTIDNIAGWEIIDVTVGPMADPLVLLWERPEFPPPDLGDADYPSIESTWHKWERPNRFRILHYHASGLEVLDLPETVQTYHHVQPLPGGEYLLVAGWTRDERPNADVYSADGRLLRSWHTGSFVTHLQATSNGAIWAGYSDKGVFENDLFSGCATCFDANGRVLVSYADLAGTQNVEEILHCYAMNVMSNAGVWVWYCDWSGNRFPLVRVIDGQIDSSWPHGTKYPLRVAPYAFAVAGDRVFFHGGYRDYDRFYLNSLSPFARAGTEVLILDDEKPRPGGNHVERQSWLERIGRAWRAPAPDTFEVFGRGSRLYLWKNPTLLMVDAASLPPT